MENDVWQLTIEKETGRWDIYGDYESLRAEVDAWMEYENTKADEMSNAEEIGGNYVDREGRKVRTVRGYMNDATRSEAFLAYRFWEVVGMAMARLS